MNPTGKVKSSSYSFIIDLNPSKDNIKNLFNYARNQ